MNPYQCAETKGIDQNWFGNMSLPKLFDKNKKRICNQESETYLQLNNLSLNNQENIENHKEFQVVRPRKSFSKKRKDQCNKYGLRLLIKKENCLQQFETQNRFNVLIPEDEQRQMSEMEEVKKQFNSNLKKCRRYSNSRGLRTERYPACRRSFR